MGVTIIPASQTVSHASDISHRRVGEEILVTNRADEHLDGAIAVIGMAGRFPGASTLGQFWRNLRDGVESIRPLSEEELLAAGESIDTIRQPGYVAAAAPLPDHDQFDAGLFNMSPLDASVFDPQHRVFLECAYEAFEHAGYVASTIDGPVGVFASCGASEYMFKNVLANATVAEQVGEWLIRHTGNDTNFLATRTSYEFDLRGPSMNVQTACSSTLVAVHLACQSILNGESDVALAGGAVIAPDQVRGYVYKDGEILSPDGHCRAFDSRAEGTVLSSAAGAVLLKPYADAAQDGDNILAVIRGSAINNDGRDKVGYLAPSVSGQARVVAEAQAVSGVEPREVSYVEAHGTGTIIGDPIEVAGATEAFRGGTDDVQFCGIGSVKSNLGHAGEAAGVVAVIKTVLSLQHRQLAPTINFEQPNPRVNFESSPFYVNDSLKEWTTPDGVPRIAAVTALGAGGTNAHVIVEQAPPTSASEPPLRPEQLVVLSARSEAGLDRLVSDLESRLRSDSAVDIADVAFTYHAGRNRHRIRRAVVAATVEELAGRLASSPADSVASNAAASVAPSVAFMMPGGGAQYANMGRDLYENEAVYRAAIDDCCQTVNPQLGFDLRSVLFVDSDLDQANAALQRPSVALPALFATGYAMTRLLESFGIEPDALIGHSAGEYVAATLAEVMDMRDALTLVALRGRLFETLESGSMLSVGLAESELLSKLPDGVSIGAINAPDLCMASGPTPLIDDLRRQLEADDIDCTPVHIDVAAHSAMLEPILDEFRAFCRTVTFSEPTKPLISNLTGTWATAEVADAEYWVRHLRQPVRFSDGVATLLDDGDRVLVEIGPGRTLTSLSRMGEGKPVAATPSLRHPRETASDVAVLLRALGTLWTSGVELSAEGLFGDGRRKRLALPTYPFDHARYWVDPDPISTGSSLAGPLRKRHNIDEWFATPVWSRSVPRLRSAEAELGTQSLVIDRGDSRAVQVIDELRQRGQRVTRVRFGDSFTWIDEFSCTIDPGNAEQWRALVDDLRRRDARPDHVFHMSAVGEPRKPRRFRPDPLDPLNATIETDYASVVFLASALSGLPNPLTLAVVTSGAVGGNDVYSEAPERALLHGAARVIPRELGHVRATAIDLWDSADNAHGLGAAIAAEGLDPSDPVVALRGSQRWVRRFETVEIPPAPDTPWRADGVYLITGGLGGIGLTVAARIAESAPGARIVLVGRTPVAPEDQWDQLLARRATDPDTVRKLRTLRDIQGHGCGLVVESADVTDAVAMAGVIDRVRTRSGDITAVIHTAGILDDALIALRSPTPGSAVIDVKAKAIMILDDLLRDHPPELIVLCSSVSSLLGLPGQVDYTAANAFLDAYAAHKNHDGRTRAVVVNWNAWQEVGMAVDAVQADQPAGASDRFATIGSPTELLDRVETHGDVVTWHAALSRTKSWLLAEHVVRGGHALIPGTGFVELMRGAVAGTSACELRDVVFLTPFEVADAASRDLQLSIEADGAVAITSEGGLITHAEAVARPITAEQLPLLEIEQIRERTRDVVEQFDGYSDQPFMDFGPRWGNLREVGFGRSEALVHTIVPTEFADEPAVLWLHPGVLDVAIGSAQKLIDGFEQSETFYVPLSYTSVRSFAPLPVEAFSHVRYRDTASADTAVFDVTIADASGAVAVEIAGFTMRRVDSQGGFSGSPTPTPTSSSRRNVAPIADALREGILASEGADALDRILAFDLGPQVIASSVDVDHWAAQVDAEAAGESGDGPVMQFARPDVAAEFEPPATPIEKTLAEMWRELLGLDRVGRNDDFFELGGQSLIAVRLFGRIRKTFSVQLELASLFEAPTIASCASLLAERLGVSDKDEPTADTATGDTALGDTAISEPAVSAFRNLVTIQKGGAATPFFCVHGAGGNVLNFRDLARAMGPGQPFYGLQMHGIDGVIRPLETVAEMATTYLAEVRTVQPHGPYLFGGYSGGGLVALEMARLAAADGDATELLVLLDTYPPVITYRPATWGSRLRRLTTNPIGFFRGGIGRRHHNAKMQRLDARVAEVLARGDEMPNELRNHHLSATFYRAAGAYTAVPFDVRSVLLRASDVPEGFFDSTYLEPDYGWSQILGSRFELVVAPGDHDTLVLGSNADLLVAAIREDLVSV